MRISTVNRFVYGIIVGLFVFSQGSVLAQPPSTAKEAEEMRLKLEQQRREIEEQNKRNLEAMKVLDPKLYAQIKAMNELQEKINPILTSLAEKRIDEATAKTQLYPLVKAQIDLELKDIDKELTMLRKRLEELEQLKRNPEEAIQERIKMFLSPIEPPAQK